MQLANDRGKVTYSLPTVLATMVMKKATWGTMIFLGYNIIFRQLGLVFSLYNGATLFPSGSPTIKPTIGHTAIHFWNGLLRELYIDASHFLDKLL